MHVNVRQKLYLLLLPLLLLSWLLVASSPVSADPSSTKVKCQDGKTVTAYRSGSAFTTKDYQNACKKHKGYKTPAAPKAPTTSATSTNTSNAGTAACPTGAEKACTVNSADGCSTKGDTIDNCTDPALGGGGNVSCNDKDCNLINKYVNPLVALLSALVGIVVTISIIFAGIQYASAGGDPQKVTAAKNRIRNSIIALVAFLFLYALLQFLIPGGIFKS